jgi:hypothetical protein
LTKFLAAEHNCVAQDYVLEEEKIKNRLNIEMHNFILVWMRYKKTILA